jgi:hypothetical protein
MRSIDFVSTGIRFLREQDGPPERKLKQLVLPVLREDRQVQRVYLASVQLAEADSPSVMMAVVREQGGARDLNDRIAAVFHELFSTKNSLDVAFITASQEADLARVCDPFYRRAAPSKPWFKKLLG